MLGHGVILSHGAAVFACITLLADSCCTQPRSITPQHISTLLPRTDFSIQLLPRMHTSPDTPPSGYRLACSFSPERLPAQYQFTSLLAAFGPSTSAAHPRCFPERHAVLWLRILFSWPQGAAFLRDVLSETLRSACFNSALPLPVPHPTRNLFCLRGGR